MQTAKGHSVWFFHRKSDGACSLDLFASHDGKTLSLSQKIDVRFCQAMQLPAAQAVVKVAP